MTNPDNVGGLPELPAWMSDYTIPNDEFEVGKDVRLSDRMRAYGELCRAAPAGGEPAAYRITDGEGSYEYRDELPDQRSIEWSARYGRKWEPLYTRPQVSAPAGSGEVDRMIHEIENEARRLRVIERVESTAAWLERIAALLCKLQQGDKS